MKSPSAVYFRVGNHWVNKYEIRSVELHQRTRVTITFKDSGEITVSSHRVPDFLHWLNGQATGSDLEI